MLSKQGEHFLNTKLNAVTRRKRMKFLELDALIASSIWKEVVKNYTQNKKSKSC